MAQRGVREEVGFTFLFLLLNFVFSFLFTGVFNRHFARPKKKMDTLKVEHHGTQGKGVVN